MKIKTKLILGIGTTLVASTPIIALASCSKPSSLEDTLLEKALNNVRENILIKDKARWVLPSEIVKANNLNDYIKPHEFTPFNNYGYHANVMLKQEHAADDNFGNLKVIVFLDNGVRSEKKEITLSGFLTNVQKSLNKKYENDINYLGISVQKPAFVFPNLVDTIKDKDFKTNSNKYLYELIDIKQGEGSKLQNTFKISGLSKSKGQPIKMFGVELPALKWELELGKAPETSTKIPIYVKGFTKQLSLSDIEKLIEWGVFTKTSDLSRITTNGLLQTKLTEYFHSSISATTISSQFGNDSFTNSSDITVTPTRIISKNETEGFATIEFAIKMSSQQAKPILIQKDIFGFATNKTTAPTTLRKEGYVAKDWQANQTVDQARNSTIFVNGLEMTIVSSSPDTNNFMQVTLPSTYAEAFSTKNTNFLPNAFIKWKIKDADPNTNAFTLSNNILKSKAVLDANKKITLQASIFETFKEVQTVDVVFNFLNKGTPTTAPTEFKQSAFTAYSSQDSINIDVNPQNATTKFQSNKIVITSSGGEYFKVLLPTKFLDAFSEPASKFGFSNNATISWTIKPGQESSVTDSFQLTRTDPVFIKTVKSISNMTTITLVARIFEETKQPQLIERTFEFKLP